MGVEAEQFWFALWHDWLNNKGGTTEFADNFVPGDECVSFFCFSIRDALHVVVEFLHDWRKNRQKVALYE